MPSKPNSTSKKKPVSTSQKRGESTKQIDEQLSQSEERFSRAFLSSPTNLTVSRLSDNKFEYVNDSFLQLTEYQREDVIGKSGTELNLFADPVEIARVRQLLIENKQVRNLETTIRTKNGTIKHVLFSVDIIISDQQPYSLTTLVDITDRIRAEKQALQMKRLYATLSQVNQTIIRVKSQEELYQTICDVALKFGELTLAWIGLLEEATGDIRPVAVSGMGLDLANWPFPIINVHRKPSPNAVITDALYTSNTVTSDDVQTDDRTKALHSVVQKFGFRSLAAVPFRLRGKTIGILNLVSVEPGIFKAEEEQKLLDEMGMDISFALDTMELEKERRLAEEQLRLSEERFSNAFRMSPAGITITRIADGKFIDANESFCRMFEFSREEVVGHTSTELNMWTPEERKKLIDEQIRSGGLQNFELRARSKSGRIITILFSSKPIELEGEPHHITTMIEITERKRGEEQLRYQAHLLENVSDAIVAADANYVLKAWNRAAEKLYGWTPEEVLGRKGVPLLQTQFLNADAEGMRKQIAEVGHYRGEATQLRKDGIRIPVEVVSSVVRDEHGEISDYVSVNRDITERRQAEEKLRESQERYRLITQNAEDIIWTMDMQLQITYVSPSLERALGYTAAEIIQLPPEHLLIPDSFAAGLKAFYEEVGNAQPQPNPNYARVLELEYRRKDGSTFWSETKFSFFRDAEGRPTGILAVGRDITARRQAEELLRESEYKSRALLNAIPDLMFRLDREGIFLGYKAERSELYAQAEPTIIGKRNRDIAPPEFADLIDRKIQRTLETGAMQIFEYQLTLPARGLREFEARMVVSGKDEVTAIVRDITERKQAEQALRENEKRLRALLQISQALTTPFELNTILQMIVDNATQLMNLDSGAFYLLENDELFLATTTPALPPGFPDEFRRTALAEHPHIQNAISNSSAVILPDTATCDLTRTEREIAEARGLRSIIYLPLMNGKQAIGILILASIKELRTFSEEEIALYNGFAGQAAQIIENVQLYESTRKYAAELEIQVAERKRAEQKTQQQLKRLNAMHMIDTAISSSFDLHFVLNIVLQQVLSQLGVDAGAVLLLRPQFQKLEYAASLGFHSHLIQHTSLKLGEGYASRAVLERKAIHVSASMEANGRLAASLQWADENFVDYYGLPLIVKGEVKGVLEIYHRSLLHPDSEWHNFAEALANQAAIMIEDAQLFSELQRSNSELLLAYDATIEGWSRAMDLRDKETQGHTMRVTEMTLSLARAMNISESQLVHIRRGALLHDLGKLGVPDNILFKPDELLDEEWVIMRQHPQFAYEMLSGIYYLRPALDIPYCHHEKWDGTGYPRGLKGENIPLAARIFAVADVWDAITNERPYRKGWSTEIALNYIKEQSGKYFDPQVVEVFLRMIASIVPSILQ